MDANGGADNVLRELIYSPGIGKHAWGVCKCRTGLSAGSFTSSGRKERICCDDASG